MSQEHKLNKSSTKDEFSEVRFRHSFWKWRRYMGEQQYHQPFIRAVRAIGGRKKTKETALKEELRDTTDASSAEISEQSRFSFLKERTRKFLRGYEYKGVKPSEISAPDVKPGVIFLTADMKIPEEGPVKILEFNGVGSELRTYPEGGQEEASTRIYQTLQALDMTK